MKVKQGGAISNLALSDSKNLDDVRVVFDIGIQLWLNDSILSYIDIGEAIELRDELNEAIKEAAGI